VAKSKSKVEHVSVTKFFPVIIVPITLILSSGIIFSVFPYLDILSKSGSGAVAFYFIFVILSIMAFMGFETSSRIEGSLTPNGYEKIELEKELGFFQRDIAMLGFVSLFLSLGVIIILEISPSLNIGLIPAVIIFFVVYAIVLGTMLKKD
jgi:hypothetical protein